MIKLTKDDHTPDESKTISGLLNDLLESRLALEAALDEIVHNNEIITELKSKLDMARSMVEFLKDHIRQLQEQLDNSK